MLVVALSAWCDLTQKFIQPTIHGNKNWMVIAIYVLGFLTVVLLLGTHNTFVLEKTNLLWVGRMNLGIQYSVYAVFLWCTSISILYNLYLGRKSRVIQPNIYFVIASFLVVSEVIYGSLALILPRPVPRIVQDALIASSVIFLGISVARHQPLVERRSSLYELPIHTLVIMILVGIYAALAWQWSRSTVIVILITTLAIFTHSFYGLVGEILSQLLSKRESEYRHQLRHLGQNLSSEVSLQTHLEDGLKLLCQILGAIMAGHWQIVHAFWVGLESRQQPFRHARPDG